jgi:hypothetical protein
LWRTTSNQATTLFRVAKLSGDDAFGSTTDDLTDWEVMDPGREGFQAMPVLLPNGELNANRFGVPPDNYSVAVMFQDRLWLAGDTGTENANTIRYSEVDEPESMPDVNELLLQSNLRASDYITALIPYAGALIVAQSRHCHRLTYVAQPLIDASVFLLAYRGVLNQRCWDIFDGRIYAMDDQGVYSMDPQGNVESLTLGLYEKRPAASVRGPQRGRVGDVPEPDVRLLVRLQDLVGGTVPERTDLRYRSQTRRRPERHGPGVWHKHGRLRNPGCGRD